MSRLLCAHNGFSGVSVSLIEGVQRKGWCPESHLSAAVCTKVRASTTGMQCPHTPVHPGRRSRRLHTPAEADRIEMSAHCCTNTTLTVPALIQTFVSSGWESCSRSQVLLLFRTHPDPPQLEISSTAREALKAPHWSQRGHGGPVSTGSIPSLWSASLVRYVPV